MMDVWTTFEKGRSRSK